MYLKKYVSVELEKENKYEVSGKNLKDFLDMIDVGQRIKEERLKNGYKRQDDLCDKLHIGRNTLSAWENGKANIELGDLIKLCELFNCEVGYLLCEYDTPYRVQSDISEQTQLSTKAIENIMKSRDNHKKLFGNPFDMVQPPIFLLFSYS